MSVVLVVEPDSAQAEVLRKAVRRIDAELMLVSNTDAAIDAMRRSVPDLVLVSALLSPRDEDALFAHLRSLEGASHLQTLTIPQLRRGKDSSKKAGALFRKKDTSSSGGCDPAEFAHEVKAYLARAHELQSQAAEMAYARAHQPAPPVAPPPMPIAAVEQPVEFEQSFDAGPQLTRFDSAVADEKTAWSESTEPLHAGTGLDLGLAPDPTTRMGLAPDPVSDMTSTSDVTSSLGLAPDPTFNPVPQEWVEPPGYGDNHLSTAWSGESSITNAGEPPVETPEPPAWPPRASETHETTWSDAVPPAKPFGLNIESEPAGLGDREDSWVDLNVDATVAQPVEPEPPKSTLSVKEAHSQLTAELQRFELKAQQSREAELLRAMEEAQSRLTSEVERVQAEAEQRRQIELARVQAEAEAQRVAAVKEAREAAEAEARNALIAELEQVRLDEIARLKAEADQRAEAAAKQAREAAEAAAKQAREAAAAEAARAIAEADQRADTAAKQARAAAEADAARAKAEADQRAAAAAKQAREAAEAEASRAMAEELSKIRTQVEYTLNNQLEQARAQADQLRQAELARAQAEAAKQRDKAAEDARLAAEAAASRALETEVARVRAEAEARLQAELDVVRRETEHLRRADQSEAKQAAEKVRVAAIRDANAIAEAANQTLAAELARVRAEADARLQAEVARARAQAEQQRTNELAEIRAQVAGMRESASQQARRAAAEAIALEVVRGYEPAAPPPARQKPARTLTLVEQASAPKVVHNISEWPSSQPAHSSYPVIEMPPVPPPVQPAPVTPSTKDYYNLWKPKGETAAKPPVEEREEQSPIAKIVEFARSPWGPHAAAALVLVVGGTVWLGWPSKPHPAKASPPVAAAVAVEKKPAPRAATDVTANTGNLDVSTDPPGARVLLDGVSVGDTPIVLSKLKPGKHTLVFESNTGNVTKKVTVRSGETARISESIYSGWLSVFAGIPLKLYIGGQLRGTTDDGQLMLTPGSYNVELVSEQFNFRTIKNFTIEAGKIASYTVSLPASTIRVNGPEGTDIFIDGKPAGKTPVIDMPLAIGTHVVVGANPTLGDRRQTVEVKLGEPAEVTFK